MNEPTVSDIEVILKRITKLSNQIAQQERAFEMRRRLNPHHPAEDIKYETEKFNQWQAMNFIELKTLYSKYRQFLINYESLTSQERDIFAALDKCVMDDLEREMLT